MACNSHSLHFSGNGHHSGNFQLPGHRNCRVANKRYLRESSRKVHADWLYLDAAADTELSERSDRWWLPLVGTLGRCSTNIPFLLFYIHLCTEFRTVHMNLLYEAFLKFWSCCQACIGVHKILYERACPCSSPGGINSLIMTFDFNQIFWILSSIQLSKGIVIFRDWLKAKKPRIFVGGRPYQENWRTW